MLGQLLHCIPAGVTATSHVHCTEYTNVQPTKSTTGNATWINNSTEPVPLSSSLPRMPACAGKVTEKVGEMFEETGAVGKQFTPQGAAGEGAEGKLDVEGPCMAPTHRHGLVVPIETVSDV